MPVRMNGRQFVKVSSHNTKTAAKKKASSVRQKKSKKRIVRVRVIESGKRWNVYKERGA